jgi:hypothetical protein
MTKDELELIFPPLRVQRHTRTEWIAKFQQCGCKCYYCEIPLTLKQAEKEHKIPICRGGDDAIENIVPACKPCNAMKAWRTEAEFYEERHRLVQKSIAHGGIPKPKATVLSPEEANEPGLLKKLCWERERISWAWRNPA